MSLHIGSKKRQNVWNWITAFLLGAVFSAMTADPISDTVYFYASKNPMTPVEAIILWYYLPGLVYAILLVAAVLLRSQKKMSASMFRFLLVFMVGVGTLFSLRALGFSPIVLLLVVLPFVLLSYLLYYSVTIRTKHVKAKI